MLFLFLLTFVYSVRIYVLFLFSFILHIFLTIFIFTLISRGQPSVETHAVAIVLVKPFLKLRFTKASKRGNKLDYRSQQTVSAIWVSNHFQVGNKEQNFGSKWLLELTTINFWQQCSFTSKVKWAWVSAFNNYSVFSLQSLRRISIAFLHKMLSCWQINFTC